jgi:hypothetical protein
MKINSGLVCRALLGVFLIAFVFCLGGCGYVVKADRFIDRTVASIWTLGSESEANAQLGETEAEGRRRHLRNERINQQELMHDLDYALLMDRPSRLTAREVP